MEERKKVASELEDVLRSGDPTAQKISRILEENGRHIPQNLTRDIDIYRKDVLDYVTFVDNLAHVFEETEGNGRGIFRRIKNTFRHRTDSGKNPNYDLRVLATQESSQKHLPTVQEASKTTKSAKSPTGMRALFYHAASQALLQTEAIGYNASRAAEDIRQSTHWLRNGGLPGKILRESLQRNIGTYLASIAAGAGLAFGLTTLSRIRTERKRAREIAALKEKGLDSITSTTINKLLEESTENPNSNANLEGLKAHLGKLPAQGYDSHQAITSLIPEYDSQNRQGFADLSPTDTADLGKFIAETWNTSQEETTEKISKLHKSLNAALGCSYMEQLTKRTPRSLKDFADSLANASKYLSKYHQYSETPPTLERTRTPIRWGTAAIITGTAALAATVYSAIDNHITDSSNWLDFFYQQVINIGSGQRELFFENLKTYFSTAKPLASAAIGATIGAAAAGTIHQIKRAYDGFKNRKNKQAYETWREQAVKDCETI